MDRHFQELPKHLLEDVFAILFRKAHEGGATCDTDKSCSSNTHRARVMQGHKCKPTCWEFCDAGAWLLKTVWPVFMVRNCRRGFGVHAVYRACVHVCMCVLMFVCTLVCVYAVYVCTSTCLCGVCMHACTRAFANTCMHIPMCACVLCLS